MNKTIETIADNVVDELDEAISAAIHWHLGPDSLSLSNWNELELKVKQQVIFSLRKRITK